ncbi:exosortase [Candidatus Nitrosymbiomonas proteolyticus]|uniref:Exosortase n=1 Tax=Candidatus Nitrosymbiomonas proteolyticus TaxID=2608984 RepID=A0A809R790_9BACT|nr:exosortase [Candidatus Nitrosymbiomonas proteolyticus]
MANTTPLESEPTAPRLSVPEQVMAFTKTIVSSKAFWPGLIAALGVTALFWTLFRNLLDLWDSEDGYFSHGFLVPIISIFIIYRWWPRLKTIPVKPGWVALIPLAGLLVLTRAAFAADILLILSICLMMVILATIWLVAGWRWMVALSLPVLYLGFALPLWTFAIDVYTNPLQILSTKASFQMLQLAGFQPFMDTGTTTIYLNNFVLDVGVPCSGLKLIVAVTAFTVFFVLIGGLRWWANLVMFAVILPLCIFINGLRIALIGLVGENYGHDAGMAFHDYSGYITLAICFFILFKIARGLGWKD